jgi:predicted nuclease of predicted toxin-antitoxin system
VRVLLDENMPYRLVRLFSPELEVETVGRQDWKGMKNGELLRVAEKMFDAFITTDKGLPHQQNLRDIELIIVLLEVRSNRYDDIAPLKAAVLQALGGAQPGQVVRIGGQ